MTNATTTDPRVLIKHEANGTRITLNRPKSLNAFTVDMLQEIADELRAAHDNGAKVLILDAAGDRAFCAGGDLTMNVNFTPEQLVDFWKLEHVNIRGIRRMTAPVVTFQDGITMGGGVGLSAHASHRIATERTRMAMPEVRVGFIPDVGGSLLLANAPGLIGLHLGLTAGEMSAADAIYCGFSDYYVESSKLEDLKKELLSVTDDVDATIKSFATASSESWLAEQRDWIDECYAGDTVAEILARLDAHENPEAQASAKAIRQMSPNSLEVARAAFWRSRELEDLDAVLDMELHIGSVMIRTPDMKEGVRAQIIDKDRNPKWLPAALEEVDQEWVDNLVNPTS